MLRSNEAISDSRSIMSDSLLATIAFNAASKLLVSSSVFVRSAKRTSRADNSPDATLRRKSETSLVGVLADSVTKSPRMFCSNPLPSKIIPLFEATVTSPSCPPLLSVSNIPIVILDAAVNVISPPSVFKFPTMMTPSIPGLT